MKRNLLLTWLLLMILSSLALTNSSSLQLEHHKGDFNLSRLQGQETIHVVKLNGPEEDYGNGRSKEERYLVSKKGGKGKTGVQGGGNSANRPRQLKNSATPRPAYLIAKTTLHVSFSLVLILSFKLL